MPVPIVVSTSPLDQATDVEVDDGIAFTFNTPLLPSSVNEATVVLYRDDTAEAISGTVTLSADRKIVNFLPRIGLLELITYQAAVIGSSDNQPGGNIKASDGTDLVDTHEVTFRVKEDRFVSATEIMGRDEIEGVGPIREDDALAQVTGVLEIEETTPAGYESNVDRGLNEICVNFGEAVQQTGSNIALELTTRNVLGLDEYYGEHDGTGRFLRDWLTDTSHLHDLFLNDPSGQVLFTGDRVCWVKHTGSPDFHYNTEVIVRVRSDAIANATGHMLPEDVYFVFTTEYFPLYVGVGYIRLQMGRVIADLFDDTIRRHIHAASLDAVDQALGNFKLGHPYPAVRRYVRACTILAILDEMGILTGLQDGSKRLGDLEVRYTPKDLAKVMSAFRRAEKEKDNTLAELRAYRRQSRPMVVVKGDDYAYERRDFFMRTWQHLRYSTRPSANTALTRRMKSQLGTDHATLLSEVRVLGWVEDEQMEGTAFPWW